MTSIASS